MAQYVPIEKIKYPRDTKDAGFMDLLTKLIEMSEALSYIDNLPIIPSHADEIRREERIRAIRGTTGIEGNTLDEDEIQEVLNRQGSESLNEIETVNSGKVHDFIMEYCAKNQRDRISEAVIKQIHALNTKSVPHPNNQPGQYRNFEVNYGYPVKKTPLKTSPDIQDAMKGLMDWINDDESVTFPHQPWVIKGILTHYAISRIHPFAEGNGRTARATEALIFCHKANINDYCFYGVANYCYRHRNEYIGELSKVDISGDATSFLLFCVTGFQESINYVKYRITKIISELIFMDYVYDLKRSSKMSKKAVEVLETIVKMKEIPLSDYYKIFFTDRTGESKRQYLKKYETYKLIKTYTKEDKGTFIAPNLDVLKSLRRIV